jgi:VWFA-related protein
MVALAGVVVGAGQSTPTQPQRPMFRSQVEYVEVDVLVTDAAGRFVPGLRKEDFLLREDGRPQTITAFSLVNVPIDRIELPLFASQPIPHDVQTNERPFEGRIYVLLLDDLHVDATRSQRAKNAARAFIEKNLAPNDLMAVLTVGGSESATQEFTSNKSLLLAAVDNFLGSKIESATLARNNEYFLQLTIENRSTLGRDTPIVDPHELTRQFNARATLRTIRDVAEWFGGVRGRRKSLLMISEGLDIDPANTTSLGPAGTAAQIQSDNSAGALITNDMLEAIGAAQRSNVTLYTIDPRGLTNAADDSIAVTGFATQNEALLATGTVQNVAARSIGPASSRDELLRSQGDLRTLAEETGGLAAVNTNNFDVAFDRIVDDSSSYYVLAYYPPSEKRDGKFHKIDVQVKRPGVTVRARHGYAAPRGAAPDPELPSGSRTMSPELRDTLSSPLPISGLTMHVFAAPFRGEGPNASVLLGVDAVGANLNLSEKNTLELSYMALDTKRKISAGNSDRLNMNLKEETKSRARQTGLRILNRMDLAPGRYQLRVASHDSGGGAVGSVTWDLEVPDFNKDPLTMSGVVLTSVTSSTWPTGKADEHMRKVLPAQPTALRAFPQNDEIALFAEVYDNRVLTPHQVEIVATLMSNEGRVLFKTQEERSSIEIAGGSRGAFGYTARIPLRDVPPGNYVLSVRARSSLNGGDAERQLQFVVKDAAPARSQAPNTSPAVRTVEKGDMSSADSMRQVSARTDAEWTAIWRQHASNRPQPKVDFAREMVVGIFVGSRPTAGHSVDIVGTRIDQEVLVVQYRERGPGRGDVAAQVITSPYHLVAIPTRPGTVRFEKIE